MIFFWDRNVPKSIPEAMRNLNPPFGNEIHREHFPQYDRVAESGDENWLYLLGQNDWFLLTRNHRIHRNPNELAALRRLGIGCFYIWGRKAQMWDIAQCFVAAAPAIISAADSTLRPFIYRVDRLGRLASVPLP